jgi:hypothetical protein
VTLDVFTVAFRKIAEQTYPVSLYTTLTWDAQDNWGKPVASGLYYLRVQVNGPQPVTKIFKVLVLR